jgi:3-hydroxybutyryl-CoA dehydrogenase
MMEVAPALQSAPEAVEAAEAFWTGLGLATCRVADGPGLVRARVVCALVNEAATALAEGVASARDIDVAMRLGTNYPYGPLAWGDLIGLDVVLGVMRGLQAEFGEERYRPCPLLARYVLAGRLGQKAGRGFFDY